MAQKLLKHELVERLLKLKEKQDELTVQMQNQKKVTNLNAKVISVRITKTAAQST